MATERKHSKGRFLYLFDWNAKSRKKLFSKKAESFDAEGSSQGNENVDSLAIPQYLLEFSEHGDHLSFRGNGNYSCASSINGDDGYGTKPPGVVARLMGLDSMPTTTSFEPTSFSSYEPHPIVRSYYPKSVDMGYNYEPRMTKVKGSPLERFQTEVLPPRSAKPISITHHKLLSPIKSPGFVPTKDAASIMEAASRIIDSAPQSTRRVKRSSLGTPSSSFRIHDLKDKIDAAKRSSRKLESLKTPKTPASIQQGRGTTYDRSSRKSLFTSSPVNSSVKVKNKGKSIPLVVQDRANAPQKERLKLKQKEPLTQKVGPSRIQRKKSSNVLRQNNEKQNNVPLKDQSIGKSSVLNQPRKNGIGENYVGPSKIVSKVFVNSENGSKKVVTTTLDQRHALNGVSERKPLNRMKNISRSEQFASKDKHIGEKMRENSVERASQHDLLPQGNSRKDMDVISFTFTSQIKKAKSCDNVQPDGSSSLPHKGLSGSLNLLLEQKIWELTDKIGSTTFDLTMEGLDANTASCLSQSLASNEADSLIYYENWSDKDHASVTCDDDCSSSIRTISSHFMEDVDGVEEKTGSSNNKYETNGESHLGPVNIPVPDCSKSESWISSTSYVTHGNGHPSSPQSQEVTSCLSIESVHPREDESDHIDTSSYWELEYIKYTLHYTGLKKLRLDRDFKNIDPCLFDLLENLINTGGSRNSEPCSKLDRKILFDCVSEIINSKCERAFFGSYKSWVKWRMLLQNEWLTEEVYKVILCWKNMGNLIVDEVVDLDMSTYYGKWIDFEFESLEEGIDIEKEIVESLIDELVGDLTV